MLRLAAWRMCDAGIVPNMLIHDGVLIEVRGEEEIECAKEIMRAAGREVCGGFEIGVDVDQRLERCNLTRPPGGPVTAALVVMRNCFRRLPASVLTLARTVARFPRSIPQIGGVKKSIW